MALVVLNPGRSMQGVLCSTAYRGNLTFLKGRNTSGQWEFRRPQSSAEAARSCYVVDWEDDCNYTVVIGSSTSDARDKNTSSTKYATFHSGGWYRTNKVYIQGGRDGSATASKYKTRTTDTAFFTEYSSAYWVLGWAYSDNDTYQGYLTDSSNGTGLFSTNESSNMNANFQVTGIDNASAAPYGRDYWVEFKAIQSRVEGGYIAWGTAAQPGAVSATY